MGRGKGAPIALPPRYCHLAPQTLDKQTLVAHFFALKAPLVDPYPIEEATVAATELPQLESNESVELADDEWPSDESDRAYELCEDYDDSWDELADCYELAQGAPSKRHTSRARFELERTSGRQRHAHVSVHQLRRAELKASQRHSSLEIRRARVESPLAHCLVAPGVPSVTPAAYYSYSASQSSKPAQRRSAWGSGPSAGRTGAQWEASPVPGAPTIQTATGRRVQLSREEQEVAAAIQASLNADANMAGGLTMEQLAELLTRDLSPNDYEMLLRLDETVQKKTLTAETVAKLCPQRAFAPEDQGGKCTICQSEYEDGESLQCTPCAHTFHADCLLQWLTTSSTKCALCNKALE